MMSDLNNEARFITEGVKAVSQFLRFPGPDGKYFARLGRITWAKNKKQNCFVCTATFSCLGYAENGSQEHGGKPIVIKVFLKEGKNSDKQAAWDRVFTTIYQPLNCNTAAWAATGVPIGVILQKETDRLNTEKPPVLLTIRSNEADKRFYNVDILDVLVEAQVAHFIANKIDISDETYQQIESNEDEAASHDQAVAEFTTNLKKAEEAVRAITDPAPLVQQILKTKSNVYNETILAKYNVKQLQDILLVTYCESAGQEPAEFGLSAPPLPNLDVNQFTTTEQPPFDHTPGGDQPPVSETGPALQSMLQSSSIPEEDDDDEPVMPVAQAVNYDQLKACIAGLSRDQIKIAIHQRDNTVQFSKKTDTSVYADMLFHLITQNSVVDTDTITALQAIRVVPPAA